MGGPIEWDLTECGRPKSQRLPIVWLHEGVSRLDGQNHEPQLESGPVGLWKYQGQCVLCCCIFNAFFVYFQKNLLILIFM